MQYNSLTDAQRSRGCADRHCACTQIGWLDYAAMRVFDRFARAAIKVGSLRIVLPNGNELAYGDLATTAPAVIEGR